MINAIVYTSNTGFTKQYAQMLSDDTGIAVYSLEDAKKSGVSSEIIYLGWLMAGTVKGLKKAQKLYKVCAVCGVGMAAAGLQESDVRKTNKISDNIPVFTMRGGFDINKLHGIYKFMMNAMSKTVGKKLAEKEDRTPDEDIMLDMMLNGKNCVCQNELNDIEDWLTKYKSNN